MVVHPLTDEYALKVMTKFTVSAVGGAVLEALRLIVIGAVDDPGPSAKHPW